MYGKDSTAARQFVATLTGATASTLDFVGGTLSGLGVTGPTNAITNAAKVLDQAAYSLNAEGVNQAAQNVVTDVTNAKGFVNKGKALIDSVIANPKSLNVVAVEVVQEGLPIALGYGLYNNLVRLGTAVNTARKAGIGLDVFVNAAESAGAAWRSECQCRQQD